MTTPYLVPLQPTPQKFAIFLAGVQYVINYKWCAPFGAWIMDISDAGGDPIVTGIPLITGSDLLGQFEYLGIGGGLIVQTTSDAVPTDDNLGTTSNLYFVTNP